MPKVFCLTEESTHIISDLNRRVPMILLKNKIFITFLFVLLHSATNAQINVELINGQDLLLNFGYTPAGLTSTSKLVRFRASNIISPLTISAPTGFTISKNNIQFTGSIIFQPAEITNINSVYVRFTPSEMNLGYGGSITFTSNNTVFKKPDLSASSLPESLSLDVVNWNISWLGSEYNGPLDDQLQASYVARVMDSLKADIYLLEEIADTSYLGYISRSIQNGPYDYSVSPYASNASNTLNGNWRIGQKMAFLYKSNVFSNVTTRGFTINSSRPDNYYNWASGRYPFRMDANATIDGKTKRVAFLNIHAKAELGDPNDYLRRKGAAELLYDSLFNNHISEYFLIGGDFNDDLDETISPSAPVRLTPYYSFINDYVNFSAPSYWNSQRGDNSYIGYPNVIDHVILSQQMSKDYVPYSCIIRKEVTDWVSSYRDLVSDHYPVQSRYNFQQSPSNLITSLNQLPALKEAIRIIHVAQADPLVKFITPVKGTVSIRLISADGKTIWGEQLKYVQSGAVSRIPMAGLPQGLYLLNVSTPNGILSEKIIR